MAKSYVSTGFELGFGWFFGVLLAMLLLPILVIGGCLTLFAGAAATTTNREPYEPAPPAPVVADDPVEEAPAPRRDLRDEYRAAPRDDVVSAISKEQPKIQTRIRTWTSADSEYTVEAQFVKANPTTVTLKREDGTTVDVPRESLCEDDLEYIRKERYRK